MPERSPRQVMLEVIRGVHEKGAGHFQSRFVLAETARRLGVTGHDPLPAQQAILAAWNDLIRQGIVAWGYNLSNTDPPFCHLSTLGREALQHLARDPTNPEGYSLHLTQCGLRDPIATSYADEAVRAFNSDCVKSAVVMVGCAAEAVLMGVRDEVVAFQGRIGIKPLRKLQDWRAKTVADAVHRVLDDAKGTMPSALREKYESYWPALVGQLRMSRNEAGHPQAVDPVTPEQAHAALLVFPLVVDLSSALTAWIKQER